MIFGKTYAQKARLKDIRDEHKAVENQTKQERQIMGLRRFALWPTKMSDGRYRWLWFYWVSSHGWLDTKTLKPFVTIFPDGVYPHNRFWEYDQHNLPEEVIRYLKEKYVN